MYMIHNSKQDFGLEISPKRQDFSKIALIGKQFFFCFIIFIEISLKAANKNTFRLHKPFSKMVIPNVFAEISWLSRIIIH